MSGPATTTLTGWLPVDPADPSAAAGVQLPVIAELLAGDAVVDRVPVETIRLHDHGRRVVVAGAGTHLRATATWTWTDTPLPRWDLALTVTASGGSPIEGGLLVSVAVPADRAADPAWSIPGQIEGETRPAGSAATCPRVLPAGVPAQDDPAAASAWSFRADRAATPVVIGRGADVEAALALWPVGDDGEQVGLGFAAGAQREAHRLTMSLPARETPIGYTGGPPAPPDTPTMRWAPGMSRQVAARLYLRDPADGMDRWRAAVLRDLHAWLAVDPPPRPRLTAAEAALLAADALLRWHARGPEPLLWETIAFERPDDPRAPAPGDRPAMHVAWLSGAPAAAALLAHGRRTGDVEAIQVGRGVLDAICAHLAPCGTFWGQWTARDGWTKGWTPGPNALHARTLAEAALFLGRAIDGERQAGQRVPSDWVMAFAGNVAAVRALVREDGRVPAAWDGVTGDPLAWIGTAGLAWAPVMLLAAGLLGDPSWGGLARRIGAAYLPDIHAGVLAGAPEDVDLVPTSEDAYVALQAMTLLAEAEPPGPDRDRWLAAATVAADRMLTFRYAWDVPFPTGSFLGDIGFRSRGLDQASPANQHLHTYGLICLPEAVRLAGLSGDGSLLRRSQELFVAARQVVAAHDGEFGARRGMTPERYHQTRYGGPHGSIGPLSHAWCLGLLLWSADAAADLPELRDA